MPAASTGGGGVRRISWSATVCSMSRVVTCQPAQTVVKAPFLKRIKSRRPTHSPPCSKKQALKGASRFRSCKR
eukprot:1186393-Prorocentrum_minimum.AAC.5